MVSSPNLPYICRFVPVLFLILVLCGCSKQAGPEKSPPGRQTESELPATGNLEKQGKQTPATAEKEVENRPSETDAAVAAPENNAAEELTEKPRELGPPLVDHAENMQKLHPIYPVWIDAADKQVVMVGEICQTNAPLEMFACLRGTKEHESIVAVPTEAYIVHAALLRVGAKSGKPVQFTPKYIPASGSEIDITVRWKDLNGEVRTARAQDWIREMKTGKALTQPWIFGGSGFWKDESTGKEYYQAEGGDFICVANFPSAMLDLPIESSESNTDLMFQAFTDRIPPRGTPVTLILKPKAEDDSKN